MTRKKKKQTTRSKRTSLPVKSQTETLTKTLSKHQQQLELALDAAKMGIWEWRITSNKIEWTSRVRELFGVTDPSQKITFEYYQSLIFPADIDHVLNTIRQAVNKGTDYFIQHRIIHPNGNIRWIEAIGKVYRNKKGEPIKMLGTVVDITEKKIIELEKEDWKRRYEIVTDALGQVVYDYDIPTGNIIWGGNTRGILGFDFSEMGNIDQWGEMIHPDDRANAFQQLEKARTELIMFDVKYRFRDKKGHYRIMHDKGTFLPDENGKANRMLGMMIDITQQVNTQTDLTEKNFFIERIAAALPDTIYVFDIVARKAIYANRSLVANLGYKEPEVSLYRDNVNLLLHPDDQQNLFKISQIINDVRDGEVWSGEYRIKHSNGSWRWMLTVNSIFKRDESGKPIQIIGTTKDITEQKNVSESLQEQNEKLHSLTEELRRKVMQLEEFTQIVSHNLRSPVGNILTLLTYYENAASEAEKLEYFNLLKEVSQDISLTLNELNEVLRIKQDYYLERQEIDFEKILNHVQNMLSADIAESKAEIKTDFSVTGIKYPTIYLESILLNLISNSVKYRSSERSLHICIRTFKKGKSTILELTDNGLGIDMDRYGHQLFRMRKTFHNHPEARGVGLFITKSQVEAMGGEITAHGKVNEGMSFIITFNKNQNS